MGERADFYLLELVANAVVIVEKKARFLFFSRLRQCSVTVHHSLPVVVNFTCQMGLWNIEQKHQASIRRNLRDPRKCLKNIQ